MALLKIRSDHGLEEIYEKIHRIMDEMIHLTHPITVHPEVGWIPDSDLYETEKEFLLFVNLAGVALDDIDVSFQADHLNISGKRTPKIPKTVHFCCHKLEMGHGRFQRIFRLPARIDRNSIDASFADGLLRIRMKKEVRPDRRSIELK
jgi:HSP20 family protein